jgi:enoyl-CoA hydratase/carnithine racemase
MTNKVKYTKKGEIGHITLDNPEQSNPITKQVLNQLIAAFETSSQNHDTCVIYRANGKNFTFGADLKYGYDLLTHKEKQGDAVEYLWSWQDLTIVMLNHPGIIITGYHGWIVGGGFEHTLACDFRIAADDTRIMLPELEMGLFYSNASTKLLSQIVGTSRAKELMILGKEISAEQALNMGLVNKVCSPDDLDKELEALADEMLKKDKTALFMAKKQINDAHELTTGEVLFKEGRAMILTAKSEGCAKRIKKFLSAGN